MGGGGGGAGCCCVGSAEGGSARRRFFLTSQMVAPMKLSIARPAIATMVVAVSLDISMFLPLPFERVEFECGLPGERGGA